MASDSTYGDGDREVAVPAPPTRRRGGGRPTREAAARLDDAIRESALRLFLETGYEGTSMDSIAAAAGTTKMTLYARYPDKAGLFRTVFEWAMSRADWPIREPTVPDSDDLEVVLTTIARAAVRRVLNPSMVRLSRIAVAQAERFPELARSTSSHPTRRRRELVIDLLEKHAASGEIELPVDAGLVADLFLGLVSGVPARLVSLGAAPDRRTQERHTTAAVELFVRALQPR